MEKIFVINNFAVRYMHVGNFNEVTLSHKTAQDLKLLSQLEDDNEFVITLVYVYFLHFPYICTIKYGRSGLGT